MKKRIMVHYRIVPTDEYDSQHHPVSCWCLKLTRFRIIGLAVVIILSVALVFTTIINSGSWNHRSLVISSNCLNSTSYLTDSDKKNQPSGKFNSPLYKQRLPTVIIIGARKAGTRALLQFLGLHKGIAAAKNETHFFDRNYDKGLKWYQLKMAFSFPHQITIEKTPNYFVDGDVPERIYRYNASIKLLLIVRNPIDRTMSDYIQLKGKNKQIHQENHHSFEELVIDQFTGEINKSYSPIKRSLYRRHIEKWLRYFSLDQILILDGENIKTHPWEEIAKVEQFLGLSETIERSRFIYNQTKGFYCIRSKFHNTTTVMTENKSLHRDNDSNVPYIERCLAKSKGRKHPVIKPEVRQKLKEFFEPYNKRFFDRVNQSFNWL